MDEKGQQQCNLCFVNDHADDALTVTAADDISDTLIGNFVSRDGCIVIYICQHLQCLILFGE